MAILVERINTFFIGRKWAKSNGTFALLVFKQTDMVGRHRQTRTLCDATRQLLSFVKYFSN